MNLQEPSIFRQFSINTSQRNHICTNDKFIKLILTTIVVKKRNQKINIKNKEKTRKIKKIHYERLNEFTTNQIINK